MAPSREGSEPTSLRRTSFVSISAPCTNSSSEVAFARSQPVEYLRAARVGCWLMVSTEAAWKHTRTQQTHAHVREHTDTRKQQRPYVLRAEGGRHAQLSSPNRNATALGPRKVFQTCALASHNPSRNRVLMHSRRSRARDGVCEARPAVPEGAVKAAEPNRDIEHV